MSTAQRLTLIGLYNYDNTLFDGLTLPDAYDKSRFIDALLLEHGEKCVIYPDLPFMKYTLGALGRKWYHELERIAQTLNDTYNPLHNYDRSETYSDQIYGLSNESTTGWVGGGNTRSNSPDYTTNQTVDGKVTEKVSAFNSSTYEPSKETTTNSGTTKISGKTEDITENFGQNSNGTNSESEQKTITHTAHLAGNIGVTTSQQMAEAEVELRRNFNLYAVAAGIFANEILINIF